MFRAEVPQRQPLHKWQPLQLFNKRLLELLNSEEWNKPNSHRYKRM